MTINTTVSRVDAPGNGSSTTFSFSPIIITQASDLMVWLLDNAGNQTLLSQGTGPTNYAINTPISYPGTGSITYPGAGGTTLATGWKLTIKQRVPQLQQFQPTNQGAFLASSYGQAYDYMMLAIQSLQEQINRVTIAAETDTGQMSLPTQVSRSNQNAGWDGNGNWTATLPASGAPVSVSMQPIVNASTTATAFNLLAANALTTALSSNSSGHFWASAGALVHRLYDRLFVGGAANNGGNAGLNGGDWLNGYQSTNPLDPMSLTQFAALSDGTNGDCEVAVLGGVRSLYHTNISQSSIGVAGYAYNNNATYATGGWCYYGESYRMNDTVGRTYGAEICVINQSGVAHPVNPYSVPAGASIGLQLDSGNGFGVAEQSGLIDSGCAVLLFQNTNDASSPFSTGICMLPGAVKANSNSFAEMLSMPQTSGLQWYTSGASPASFINCTTSSATEAGQILLQNAGVGITAGAANSPVALFEGTSTSAVNFLVFNNGSTTVSPAILAAGTDTNVSIVLAPQNAGATEIQSHLRPTADNTYTCGISGARWSVVYAVNGTIQTSDPTLKTDMAPLPAALPIVAAVNPITFKWIDGGQQPVTETYEADEPVYEMIDDVSNEHQVQPDGSVHLVAVPIQRRKPIMKQVPVTLPDGTPVIDQVPYGKAGAYRSVPRIHEVPVTQKVTKTRTSYANQPGKRTHWGFAAPDIKAATPAGMDWAAYVKDEHGVEHIRPDQLIPVLWKAVQELAAEVAALKAGMKP